MVDSQRGAWRRAGYYHFISYKRELKNLFDKNAHKISRILPRRYLLFYSQLIHSFNFEQKRTVAIFGARAWYDG